MIDTIPVGHLSLCEAFQKYHLAKRGEAQTVAQSSPEYSKWHKLRCANIDADEMALAEPFLTGRLEALVFDPKTRREVRITRQQWQRAKWPSRMFLSDTVFDFNDGPLANLSNRTAYVSARALDEWMREHLRDWFIEELKYGRIDPQDAERRLADCGFDPLESRPNTVNFNPMTEPYWSLCMAVAWIVWRTPESVRAHWNEYRSECWDFDSWRWRVGPDGEIHEGWRLEVRSPSTLVSLSLEESLDEKWDEIHGQSSKSKMSVKDARLALWGALQSGRIQATGIPEDGGTRQAIAAHNWQDLDFYELQGRETIRPRPGVVRTGYTSVTVPLGEVVRIWPVVEGNERPENGSPPISVADLRRQFQNAIHGGELPEPRTRSDIRNWGKQKFGERVTQSMLDTLDKEDAKKHPRQRGRRPTGRTSDRANSQDN